MSTNLNEKSRRREAALIGIFFILAAISSIVGLKLYDPVLASPNFITTACLHGNNIVAGALNELILAASATGTAILLYPYLKKYHVSLGIGYLSFRLLEVVFIMMGIVAVLTVLSISRYCAAHPLVDHASATTLGLAFIAFHDWTFMLGPNFMLAINTFLYSYTFYQTGLVPRKLAILGMLAACLIMLAALLEMFGVIKQLSPAGMLLALPIAAYEMTLATWLLVKGFSQKAV